VSGGVLGLGNPFPEEPVRFQLPQLVQRSADVPQGVEPLPVGGERFQLRFHDVQLALQLPVPLAGLFDLCVQLRQFIC
jgi:hypothetical protein